MKKKKGLAVEFTSSLPTLSTLFQSDDPEDLAVLDSQHETQLAVEVVHKKTRKSDAQAIANEDIQVENMAHSQMLAIHGTGYDFQDLSDLEARHFLRVHQDEVHHRKRSRL